MVTVRILPSCVLEDNRYRVPAAPAAPRGMAWVRAHVARFSEGFTHARRRALFEDVLARLDIDPAPGEHPTVVLLRALGLTADLLPAVELAAQAYQPHAEQSPAADRAADHLVDALGARTDETAARVSVLLQAHAATPILVERLRSNDSTPPLAATRRIGPDGSEVAVALADAPFGRGRHACPGRTVALRLARAAAGIDACSDVTTFRALHREYEALVLPNAWDVGSALGFVAAGFPAVGTTSLGVAAAAGRRDAGRDAKDLTEQLARRLVGLPVPVSVDIEDGFADEPNQVAEFVQRLPVAGVNIEDSTCGELVDPARHAAKIAAIKDYSRVFVNARIDTYWLGCAAELRTTLARALAYVSAGAHGIFVPGALAEEDVAELARELPVPLNVLAPADSTRARLTELGVRRISTGSLPYRAALDTAVAVALDARDGRAARTATAYAEIAARTVGS